MQSRDFATMISTLSRSGRDAKQTVPAVNPAPEARQSLAHPEASEREAGGVGKRAKVTSPGGAAQK